MKSIGLIFIGLLTYLGAFSQLNFTEIHTSIPTFTGGTYDWRDYDHDGDSDLVIYVELKARQGLVVHLDSTEHFILKQRRQIQ